MSTEENNTGSNMNQRKPFYRPIDKSTSGTSTSTRLKMVREVKFHLHHSMQRKSSEYFGKIKEAIITKINLEFDNPIEITESFRMGTENMFSKPVLQKGVGGDDEIKAEENMMFMEGYKINFTFFPQSELKFKEQWVKAFALIWDSYCSREVCVAIKEMPDFEFVISNDPLILLGMIKSLMHTLERAKYP